MNIHHFRSDWHNAHANIDPTNNVVVYQSTIKSNIIIKHNNFYSYKLKLKFKFTFVNSPKPPGQCVSLFHGSLGYERSMFLSPCRQIFYFYFNQHGICRTNLIYNENQFHIFCYYLMIFFKVYSRYEQR